MSVFLQCTCRKLGERGKQEDFPWSGKSQNTFFIFKQKVGELLGREKLLVEVRQVKKKEEKLKHIYRSALRAAENVVCFK